MAYLNDIIIYLKLIGFYDVILPLLLIFSITYALLEKTKILGVETFGGVEYPRRSVNLIVAFSFAAIGVGSSQIVSILNKSLGPIVILLLLAMFTLLFISMFSQDSNSVDWDTMKYYSYAILIALIFIFIWAIGWMDDLIKIVSNNVNLYNLIGVLFLFGFIALMITWMIKDDTSDSSSSSDKKTTKKKE